MSSYNPFRGDENPFEDDPAQQIFADEKRDRKENFRVKNFTPKLSFLIIFIAKVRTSNSFPSLKYLSCLKS